MRRLHFCLLFIALLLLRCDCAYAAESMLPLADPNQLPPSLNHAVAYPSRAADLDAADLFVNPPQGYGEVPFWWWTGDPLDEKRLEWQIEKLHENGISGMQVNYAHRDTEGWPTFPNSPEIFSESWWGYYSHASQVAAKYKMGIGLSTYTLDWTKSDNLFNRIIYNDPAFHAQQLRGRCVAQVKPGESIVLPAPTENSIGFWQYPTDSQSNDSVRRPGTRVSAQPSDKPAVAAETLQIWEFWYVSEPGTLNPVHPLSGQRVIDKFFQPFEDNNPGKTSAGLNYFFNDELRLGTGNRGWFCDFPQEFQKYKGYDLFAYAPALFADWGNATTKIRMDFADVLMHLTELRYFKPIYLWHYSRGMTYGCDNNGRGYSPTEYGDYFRAIRWYSAPGHDTPGGHADFIKGKVSSSIANLYQRPRVWLEGYHSLGWGANPNGLMYATNENYIYGCTLLNLHGLYYTTHGSAWEWAPPCYHFRMPYWKHLGTFLKYFERLSYLMSQGVWQSEIAIMYPTTPGAAGLDANQREATDVAFAAARRVYASGRDITFMDDQSVLRATIETEPDKSAKLCVSGMKFAVYVLPSVEAIRWDVLVKLREFQKAGGTVVCIGKRPRVSDRAGANDPELDNLVAEMFREIGPTNAKENNQPAKSKNVPPREYSGGFNGYWAWTNETNQKSMTAVGTLSGLSDAPKNWQIRFACDNHGDLYINDKIVCKDVDYSTGWKENVELKNGDRIRIEGRDDDNGDHTAGVFFAISDGKKTYFSTLDLKYQRNGKLFALDPTNTHNLHRFGQNSDPAASQAAAGANETGIWKPFAERLATFPQDVKGPAGIKFLHRRVGFRDVYLVMGAPQGETVAFRALGQAQRWDPMSGKRFPLTVESVQGGYSTISMPLDANQATLVVFDSRKSAAVVANAESNREIATESPLKTTAQRTLEGSWEVELTPTMDNQWGDFRLPVTEDNRTIGAEARRLRYRAVNSDEQLTPMLQPDFDDSSWPLRSVGFGQQFWLTKIPATQTIPPQYFERLFPNLVQSDAPLASNQPLQSPSTEPNLAEANLANLKPVPYCFSWRSGIEGNPGHQGWHGLKENISDSFIGLGATRAGHNEELFVDENPPQRYYLATTVCGKGPATIQKGGNLPDAVYLDGQPIAAEQTTIVLSGKPQALVLSYPRAGRGYWLIQPGSHASVSPQVEAAEVPPGTSTKPGLQSSSNQQTPLSTTWYDLDCVPFQVGAPKVGVYRFRAPAGLKRLVLTLNPCIESAPSVTINGAEISAKPTDPVQPKTKRWVAELQSPSTRPSVVAITLSNPQCEGGAAFVEPIRLETGPGMVDRLGDWSKDGTVLANYSGGAVYRKTITVSESEATARAVILDLGSELGSTAEVRVNGQSAGVLVAAPWTIDLTGLVKAGENRLEIEVCNTLANHYSTLPTRYKGPSSLSGLIGPIRILFQK